MHVEPRSAEREGCPDVHRGHGVRLEQRASGGELPGEVVRLDAPEGDRDGEDQERSERDHHARAFAAARERVLELDASLNRTRGEVDELRHSMSWRITAPLRTLYDGVRRVVGRNRA